MKQQIPFITGTKKDLKKEFKKYRQEKSNNKKIYKKDNKLWLENS